MPGKHNAGGCGCCEEGLSCWDGCPAPESLIISGVDLGISCGANDVNGTYSLDTTVCINDLGAAYTCDGTDYDRVFFGIVVALDIVSPPNKYRMRVSLSAGYDNLPVDPGNRWSEFAIYSAQTSLCLSGTRNLPLTTGPLTGPSPITGPNPSLVLPTTVTLVWP